MIFWGSGSQLKVIINLFFKKIIHDSESIYIFDPFIQSEDIKPKFNINEKWFFSFDDLKRLPTQNFYVAIGNEYGFERYKYCQRLIKLGFKPLNLIHESTIFDQSVKFGNSFLAMPRVTIQPFTTIGNSCILNTSSTIDHECTIKDGVHIMGGCYIAGRVSIGSFSTIGSNSTILPDIKIGKNCFIGAGSVITKNISDNSIVCGVPGKFLKKSRELNLEEKLPGFY